MHVLKRIPVPTGDILVVQGERGLLECLSVGDYGKDMNLKADFLGLQRKPSPVRHTKLLPLEEKWVITISTQYGCSMGCKFCDVPKVGPGRNATFGDLTGQVMRCLELHPEIAHAKRINLHYARMGEPTFNPAVIDSALFLAGKFHSEGWGFHPVVSTMMPNRRGVALPEFLARWMWFKNEVMGGEAGLQLSINSTSFREREEMFNGRALPLDVVAAHANSLPVEGRKITLNFALAGYTIDAKLLAYLFPPDKFLCKLTPMHRTSAAASNGAMPVGDWTQYEPYRETEEELKAVGYDVIVFIASHEEDESRITCGNAVLSDQANISNSENQ